MPVSLEQARAAKQLAMDYLARIGVRASVGLTRVQDNYALKINLPEPVSTDIKLPSEFDGVPVRVEIIGVVRPR